MTETQKPAIVIATRESRLALWQAHHLQDLLQAPKAMEPLFLGVYFATGALSFPLWLKVIDRIGLLRTWATGMVCRCWRS